MQQDLQVILIVMIGTLLLILLVVFIVISVYFYQRSQHRHLRAIEDLRDSVQKEILIAQLEIKENTLNVISQEIHDNIGQVLSLAKLNLNKALRNDTAILDNIVSAKDLISKAIQDLRNLSKTLNNEYITGQGLTQLLQADIEIIDKTGDYKTYFQTHGTERAIDAQRQLIVYRIYQEALNNIIKHAQGDRIDIMLNYSDDAMILAVQDNGIGFEWDNVASGKNLDRGAGLYNMQNRAKLIGAEFCYESKRNIGTTLKLTLPLNISHD